MAKSRGLPPSFQIDVPREVLTGPVQLGDYLDEEAVKRPILASQPAQRLAPPQPVHRQPQSTPFPQRMQPANDAKIVPMQRAAPRLTAAFVQQPEEEIEQFDGTLQKRVKGPPRKQVNMNPETLRMVDELLSQIQMYSGQKDAKASEMFHALVSALYEARELLDLSNIQPRGRWGTPMARAFPVSLKNAFQSAIADRYGRSR